LFYGKSFKNILLIKEKIERPAGEAEDELKIPI